MIKNLRLRFGKAPGLAAETLDCTPITVFVGPNNSGKSKVLQELQRYCVTGEQSSTNVILDCMDFEEFSRQVAEERIAALALKANPNETIHAGHMIIGKQNARLQVDQAYLLKAMADPKWDLGYFCRCYLALNTMILDGHNRISLAGQQGAGDLQSPPQSSLQLLFRDDQRRATLRRIIYDAFNSYLVVDPTLLGMLRLRLSRMPPPSPETERGIHNEAVAFHGAAEPIERGSDGIKAFVGMMTEIIAGEPEVLLIDEPEAFLHPGLAMLLGREIARTTAGSGKRLFVSTHSPNFVMGCVQSGVPITIVRLTYREGIATARVLASADILRLMRNPLLRSTGVLAGLFYESVVVTESDADRAFYQEINERLLLERSEHGIRNCLFLNAQNKQTVPTILRPLRELGIAAAGVVDIDVIKDGGSVWSSAMNGAFIPKMEQQSLAILRSAARNKLDETQRDMKRDGGTALLTGTDREALENLFHHLAEYGLFVVPGGELESWLKFLGVPGHGPTWLIEMFGRMGEDPTNSGYVHAGTGDVWKFMSGIKDWLANPMRRGIPS